MSGNIYFLTHDQREAVLWAIRLGLAYDDGFPFPRDQNREILRSAQSALDGSWKDEALADLPDDLARVLRDQSIIVPQDAGVFEAIARHAAWPFWVRQEDAGGCALATIAMIAGISYEEAKRLVNEAPTHQAPINWAEGGASMMDIKYVLGRRGFYYRAEYIAWHADHVEHDGEWRYEVRDGDAWPPEPFAPVHWAQVRQPSNNHHFVVMRADGSVLDPLREGVYDLRDWAEVVNVFGVTPGVVSLEAAA